MSKVTDFFIVGNSKSGTSALYQFLDQHPQICMSSPKEPNFFAVDFSHDENIGAFTRITKSTYHSYFNDPSGNKIWGEASACYLYSKAAARKIYKYNPNAKIIAIFREPVDFLYSYHLEMLTNPVSEGEVEKDFTRALQLESNRKAGRSIPNGCLIPELLYYSERTKYADHLERYYQFFDPEQVKIFIYDDFKKDNAAVYKDILRFLKIDVDFQPSSFEEHNKSNKLKSKFAQQFVYNISHGTGALAHVTKLLKLITPRSLRRILLRLAYRRVVFKPKPPIDPVIENRLKAKFLPDVQAFSQLIKRDMVREWGYNSIDQKDMEVLF